MSFEIKLQQTKSPRNMLDKDLDDLATLEGILRDGSSIIDPVIVIANQSGLDHTVLRKCNYMHIAGWSRYYFINDIISVRNGIWEIHAHVDVLTSFKTAIRSNTAVIKRSQKNYNLYLDDGSLTVYANPFIEVKEFNGSGFGSTRELVLAVAGGAS